MAETYCGKSCGDCEYREPMNCPGCKTGPGKSWSRDCEIAACVRAKGHETCDTCGFRDNCGPFRGRDRMPQYRQKKAEADALQQAELARRAPILGKWLWIFFWLVIPRLIASLMTNDTVAGLIPGLSLPGQILAALVALASGLVLLRLSGEEERYKTAGICSLVSSALNGIAAFLPETAAPAALALSIPVAIVGFVGEYNEYTAHANVLSGVDSELSANWERLWKWYIGLFCAMMGSLVITVIAPILGLILVLLAAVGSIVVSILKLVYLYRTAKIFREFSD